MELRTNQTATGSQKTPKTHTIMKKLLVEKKKTFFPHAEHKCDSFILYERVPTPIKSKGHFLLLAFMPFHSCMTFFPHGKAVHLIHTLICTRNRIKLRYLLTENLDMRPCSPWCAHERRTDVWFMNESYWVRPSWWISSSSSQIYCLSSLEEKNISEIQQNAVCSSKKMLYFRRLRIECTSHVWYF